MPRFLIIGLAAALASLAQSSETLHVKVPMRDKVNLCANIFRPSSNGRFPVALSRTPYRKSDILTPSLKAFLDRGYAVVVQDVRGRNHSEGEFQQYLQETNDGEDTLNWITRQPWADGRAVMFGGSYVGIVQWRLALTGHAALKAIAPSVSGSDEYFDRFYSRGGAFRLAHRLRWIAENFKPPEKPVVDFNKMVTHIPLKTADRVACGKTLGFYRSALDHPVYDSYWSSLSTRLRLDQVRAAAHITGGWYDSFVESDIESFVGLRSRDKPARLVIGPWGHDLNPEMPESDFGPSSRLPLRRLEIDWFDEVTRPAAAQLRSGVRFFLMGVNEWRESKTWPPPGVEPEPFYLSSGLGANSLNGDGRLVARPPRHDGADRYVYDPRASVPTVGGAVCCTARVMPWGPRDQRRVEGRPDVLVYTSDPLAADLTVAGPVSAVLHVATGAPDTDFTAKLVDVHPGGRAAIITDGILRLRSRGGVDRLTTYKPGSIEPIEIPAGVTAHVFLAGHRIRLEVSSSNFPKYDRNPNTGTPVANEKNMRPARQTIFHGRNRPSRLVLPVLR